MSWRVAANILNKQSRTAEKGWSSSLGVGRGANNASPSKKMVCNTNKTRCFLWSQNNPEVNYFPTRISGGRVYRGSTTQQATEKVPFLGTWNVESLYRAGPLTAAARELARYKLDLVGCRRLGGRKGAQ